MVRHRRTDAAKFLRSFGLQPIPMHQLYTKDYYQEVRDAGVDPADLNLFGPFSPQAGNVYFANAQIASRSLSAEFIRLEGIMSHLAKMLNVHPQIKQIADLGGGAGMISLYLASRFSDSHFTVYDHSHRPLEYGGKRALEKSIENVTFEHASYRELAKRTDVGTHDLVLFSHGIPLGLPDPKHEIKSMDVRTCRGIQPEPSNYLMSAAQAMSQLIGDGGMAIVICHFTAWGLILLCEACRRVGLGIDWRSCYYDLPRRGKPGNWYFAFRKGIPQLTQNSYEDAQALLNLQPIVAGEVPMPEMIDRCDLSDQPESLLVDVSGASTSGRRQRARLWRCDGKLIVTVDGLDGEPYSLRGDFSQLCGLLDVIQERLNNWQSDGREVESSFLHPTLARFRDFCNQSVA